VLKCYKKKREREREREEGTTSRGLNECENEEINFIHFNTHRHFVDHYSTLNEKREFCVFRRGDESEKMFFKYPQMRLSSHEII
jgi:hypothetical protein